MLDSITDVFTEIAFDIEFFARSSREVLPAGDRATLTRALSKPAGTVNSRRTKKNSDARPPSAGAGVR